MLPPVRVRTAGDEPVPVVDGVHAAIGRAPLLLRPVLTVLSVALLPWLLAPICVVRGARSLMASLYVAAFWAWLYLLISANRLNTQGGPRRNERAQVVRPDGTPIPRLYSAGELGSIYSYLYQGTGNIGECLAFGRIAGRNAAAEAAWQ